MPLLFTSDLENKNFRIQYKNFWTNEVLFSATVDRDELKDLYTDIKAAYEEIKPKKKEQPKLRRLKRIKVK
jgi:hypothetical protein